MGAGAPAARRRGGKRSRLGERRALHRELAALVADQELRAHHLALAATAPDENARRDRGGGRSDRGGTRRAPGGGPLAEHALRLTPAGCPRAPSVSWTSPSTMEIAGEPQRITDLFTPELPSVPPGPLRARAWLLAGRGRARPDRSDFKEHLDAGASRE